jgi:hypothetical protein
MPPNQITYLKGSSVDSLMLVFSIGNILADKNTFYNGLPFSRIIGSIQSLQVIRTVSHFYTLYMVTSF